MTLTQEHTGAAALMQEASAHLKTGAFEQAIDGFTRCLSLEPTDAQAHQGRAVAYFQLKQWKSAVADFSRARQLDPADRENWVGLGMSLAMEHRIYDAIETFETLLSAHPDYVRGHMQLGLLYYQLCATRKGREHMERGLAAHPSLEERRFIERALSEQKQLDRKRYYRPDFEALRKQQAGAA